jgi:hypothetical protein
MLNLKCHISIRRSCLNVICFFSHCLMNFIVLLLPTKVSHSFHEISAKKISWLVVLLTFLVAIEICPLANEVTNDQSFSFWRLNWICANHCLFYDSFSPHLVKMNLEESHSLCSLENIYESIDLMHVSFISQRFVISLYKSQCRLTLHGHFLLTQLSVIKSWWIFTHSFSLYVEGLIWLNRTQRWDERRLYA